MQLQISPISQLPIYEQIKMQIKEQILDGSLAPGTQLPSIRMLAKELKIGVITSKRAYEDLCQEGFLISQPGRGVFVAEIQADFAKQVHLNLLRERFMELAEFAKSSAISYEEAQAVFFETFNKKG